MYLQNFSSSLNWDQTTLEEEERKEKQIEDGENRKEIEGNGQAEVEAGEQEKNNQSLMNLIDACNSVEPSTANGEKRTQSINGFSFFVPEPNVKLAEQICKRCSSRRSLPFKGQGGLNHILEQYDAAILETWRAKRSQASTSKEKRQDDSFETFNYLDLHLAQWMWPVVPNEQGPGSGTSSLGFLSSGESSSVLLPESMISAPLEINSTSAAPNSYEAAEDGEIGQEVGSPGDLTRGKKRTISEVSQDGNPVEEAAPNKRSKLDRQIEQCLAIIQRYQARGNVLPRSQKRIGGKRSCANTLELQTEYQDSSKLKAWRQGLSGDAKHLLCPVEIYCLMDANIPHWRDPSMKLAEEIVERYVQRGGILPREWRDRKNCPVREQEYQDANRLKHWKQAVRGVSGRSCSAEVCKYLDNHLPNWRDPGRKSRKQKQRWPTNTSSKHKRPSESCENHLERQPFLSTLAGAASEIASENGKAFSSAYSEDLMGSPDYD